MQGPALRMQGWRTPPAQKIDAKIARFLFLGRWENVIELGDCRVGAPGQIAICAC